MFWGSLVDSFIFQPIKPPSYDFSPVDDERKIFRLALLDDNRTVRNTDVGWRSTSSGNVIAYAYIRPETGCPSRTAILLAHGNREDIGTSYNYANYMANTLRCNVLCYDYSGYGLSTGQPSESNFYADAEAAVAVLLSRYGYSESDIVLYGVSLGTVACVKLAADGDKRRFAGVVLQAPLASVCRWLGKKLWSGFRWLPCLDRFNSARRIDRVQCPVLVVHDLLDDIIPCSHALTLSRRCTAAWQPVFTKGMGHIQPFDCIRPAIQAFVDKAIITSSTKSHRKRKGRVQNEVELSALE